MKLYSKDAKNNLRQWECVTHERGFEMVSGLVNGALKRKLVIVTPKANRTFFEQVQLEIASRTKRKVDAGFVSNKDEALKTEKTNGLGFKLPMLAKPKVKEYDKKNSHVQIKYNGLRCLITNINGVKYAYSKSGVLYPAIKHIIDQVNIPEGVTIDGELYCHGVPLQTINSWVKKEQPDTLKLKYNCYDLIEDTNFIDRFNKLHDFSFGPSCVIVPTWHIQKINITEKFAEVREEGYEGLIIRQPNFGYQSGKRNTAMIKVKQFLDAEFEVLDVTLSRDGFPMLHLESSTGKLFKVTAPGSRQEKQYIYDTKWLYIGSKVTIEFDEFSEAGVPQRCVAKHFRNFE